MRLVALLVGSIIDKRDNIGQLADLPSPAGFLSVLLPDPFHVGIICIVLFISRLSLKPNILPNILRRR